MSRRPWFAHDGKDARRIAWLIFGPGAIIAALVLFVVGVWTWDVRLALTALPLFWLGNVTGSNTGREL